eukprot:GHVS01079890.1.p1 GENE.GHVS01079890.1~~GHVS01079890.1.p1  ORF type:complete len:288 (-),score=31.10 GHVS01079890.1:204-1067(-)
MASCRLPDLDASLHESPMEQYGKVAASSPTTSSGTPSSLHSCSSTDQLNLSEKRQQCRKYFECAVKAFGTTQTGMLLKENDSTGTAIAEADCKELTEWMEESLLGRHVDRALEIGAGVGRLTPMLQRLSRRLVTVDFLEEYVNVNKANNWKPDSRPLDEFLCADATKLEFPDSTFDLVFSNWLLMYLSDEEIEALAISIFRWVKVGGFVFCRESCGEPSNRNASRDWAEGGNPTEYRPWEYYTWLLTDFARKHGYEVEAVFMERHVSTYVREAGTSGQRSWLVKRTA